MDSDALATFLMVQAAQAEGVVRHRRRPVTGDR